MPDLTDLPVEILCKIAEKCEFQPRFDLRSTSKLMKEVVDQSKIVLEEVSLRIRYPRSLQIVLKYRNRDGKTTRHKLIMKVENADLIEKAAKWIANILKKAEIGFLVIFDEDLTKYFVKKMKENLKSPLKVRNIFCTSTIDPFSICDESYVQRLTSSHNDPNFFQEYKKIIINLDKVELFEKTMSITDEDVLSMKATEIFLKSENFSAEMVNQMVDNFIAKGLIGSEFYIENPKTNFLSKIKIPDGFIVSRDLRGWHEKIDENRKMDLILRNDFVKFRIQRRQMFMFM